jgi:hypothetical protein
MVRRRGRATGRQVLHVHASEALRTCSAMLPASVASLSVFGRTSLSCTFFLHSSPLSLDSCVRCDVLLSLSFTQCPVSLRVLRCPCNTIILLSAVLLVLQRSQRPFTCHQFLKMFALRGRGQARYGGAVFFVSWKTCTRRTDSTERIVLHARAACAAGHMLLSRCFRVGKAQRQRSQSWNRCYGLALAAAYLSIC